MHTLLKSGCEVSSSRGVGIPKKSNYLIVNKRRYVIDFCMLARKATPKQEQILNSFQGGRESGLF